MSARPTRGAPATGQRFEADLLLTLTTLIAAAGWIFSKEALAGMPPLIFIGLRFLIAGLVLAAFSLPQLRALDARGLRLHDLCAAHFEAVPGHKAVQRHVLAFERRGFVAVLRKNAAERRAQQAFARAAHRALHHDAPCPAHASTSRIIFNSCSFSFWVRTAVRYHVSSSPG